MGPGDTDTVEKMGSGDTLETLSPVSRETPERPWVPETP